MLVALAAALASVAAMPRDARAEDVLVIGGGSKEQAQIATVRGALETALRKAGWVWPDRPATSQEADSLLQCEDSRAPWTCIPATISGIRAQEVHRVFVISVDHPPAASAPMLVITAKVIVVTPPSFVVRQRFCERCSSAQLVRATEDLTKQLFNELAARTGVTAIDVRSDPPGADITLDGVHAGVTDTRLVTSPGTHVAMIEKPGFVSETRALTLEAGQTAEVAVALRSAAPHPPPGPGGDPPGHSARLIPGIAIGSGVALVGLGGVALYYGHKGGPDDRYRYTRATAVGLVTGLVGIAAIGAGVYFWRGADGSGLLGTVTDSATTVTWVGRF
jgi:hypothetical protein